MNHGSAAVIPFRRSMQREPVDLALALAKLGKAVKVHESALRWMSLLDALRLLRPAAHYDAKPMGA